MEAEVFAYRALQSDAESIACDIGGYLAPDASKTPTKPNNSGSCAPVPDGAGKSLVIVSSTTTVLANFQIWRANMAIAKELLDLALAQGCPPQGAQERSFVAAAPVVFSLIQGTLALFATNQSSTGVQGAIQDQALMNGVARQLRALKFTVLMPDVYSPYTLGGLDYSHSPFLARLQKLTDERSCLNGKLLPLFQSVQAMAKQIAEDQAKLKGSPSPNESEKAALNADIDRLNLAMSTPTAQIAGLQSVIAGIDGFVASVAGAPAPAPPAAAATAPSVSPTPPAPSPTSPIVAILNADGLARAVGVQPDGTWTSGGNWRVLSLKALESGGALITESNIWGSKVHFSGGAAATYSLFGLESGSLECSGNVADYGGYVRAKDFVKEFRNSLIEPSKQLLFLRGTCSSLDKQ
jgi:hypothetical protein